MPHAILFDVDNTLIDFMKFKRASTEAAVDAMIKAGMRLKKGEVFEIVQTQFLVQSLL